LEPSKEPHASRRCGARLDCCSGRCRGDYDRYRGAAAAPAAAGAAYGAALLLSWSDSLADFQPSQISPKEALDLAKGLGESAGRIEGDAGPCLSPWLKLAGELVGEAAHAAFEEAEGHAPTEMSEQVVPPELPAWISDEANRRLEQIDSQRGALRDAVAASHPDLAVDEIVDGVLSRLRKATLDEVARDAGHAIEVFNKSLHGAAS
jgi:hypothetical protein